MANPEKLARITEAHTRGKAARQGKAPAPEPEPEKPAIDLDEPRTQDLILYPEGTAIELSFGAVKLYPPSMMLRKVCHGFAKGIIADAAETKPQSAEMYMLRVAQCLMRSPTTILRFLNLISFMYGRPGAISESEATVFAAELAEQTNEDDMAILFAALCTNCGINKGNAEAKN